MNKAVLENGKMYCDCKKTSCPRHGRCEECIEYHKKTKRAPYCKRKKTLLGKLFSL